MKIRNTFRYLLGNLNDKFDDIDLESLDLASLPELEKFILNRVYSLNEKFINISKTMIFIIFIKNY